MEQTYDVVVIGGGAAGLSGALALARARRSVLVVDAGQPRNAPAGHVHNYLGREGDAAGRAAGRRPRRGDRLRRRDRATGGSRRAARDDDGFLVALDDGREVRARRLLVTTGLVDELPDVPGLAERWGRDVLHCPYCHGWEVRDQAHRRAGHRAARPCTRRSCGGSGARTCCSCCNGGPAPAAEQAERARRAGDPGRRRAGRAGWRSPTTGSPACGWRPARSSPLDAVVVGPRFTARSERAGVARAQAGRHGGERPRRRQPDPGRRRTAPPPCRASGWPATSTDLRARRSRSRRRPG